MPRVAPFKYLFLNINKPSMASMFASFRGPLSFFQLESWRKSRDWSVPTGCPCKTKRLFRDGGRREENSPPDEGGAAVIRSQGELTMIGLLFAQAVEEMQGRSSVSWG